MAVRILLADDHGIVREGFKALLEGAGFEVVAGAANGEEAVRLAQELSPEVAVLDMEMPVLQGGDAAEQILRARPEMRVVILSMHAEEHQVMAALKAGIRGYVLKTQAADDLVQAIKDVTRGEVYLSPKVATIVAGATLASAEPRPDPLTPRERQVLQLVAEGKTSKEIAALLKLSVRTVETYRSQIMDKLKIRDTVGLVHYAIRHGLFHP